MLKTLLFDIETAPIMAYIWDLYNEVTSMDMIKSNWYVLCWGAKWLGEPRTMTGALPDFKSYKKNPENDMEVMKKLWHLIDEADILVAHNAVKFDVRKINARFLQHGMRPPSPYKVVDTLLVARRYFKFTSNRLGDLGKLLKLGDKVATGGFGLWKGCLRGDKKSWKHMVGYCKQDVTLLEKIYLKLRPYMKNHPNVNVDDEGICLCCNSCGSEHLMKRGYGYTTAGKYQRYQCTACGGWCKDGVNLFTKQNRVNRARNIT